VDPCELLPTELWREIVLFCEMKSRIAMGLSCSNFNKLINDEALWQQLFRNREQKIAVIEPQYFASGDSWKNFTLRKKEYDKFEEAIGEAPAGSKVYVKAGVYTFPDTFEVSKDMHIIGEKKEIGEVEAKVVFGEQTKEDEEGEPKEENF